MRWVRQTGLRALLVVPLLLLAESCTDLTEVPQDALTPKNAFHTDAEVLAGVAGVYAQLRDLDQFWDLDEVTTDEAIVPTRGNDWYDNGTWLELHRQTWTASSGTAIGNMNGAWNSLFSGVAKANLMIDVITKAGGAEAPKTLAELRALRAWYYYNLLDKFGNVPIVTGTELKQYPTATRSEVFAFVEKELNESRALLPTSWGASGYGRITQGAVDAMLASLYLNAGVFSKTTGVSATSYNSCNVPVSGSTNGCAAAIAAADRVINSGVYSLNPNWKNNFGLDNETSPENIFVIVHVTDQALGGNFPMRTLHYNQLNTGWGSPWNGLATLAEAYNSFDPADERRGMWLQGPQNSFETGLPAKDRTGAQLNFTINIPDATQAGEGIGVRFNKFPPMPNAPSGNGMPNDFTFFRLAEMYLIKAEAELALGQTGAALTDLNIIHSRHFTPPQAVGVVNQDAILKERLFELAGENKRRTDLIRFGRYLNQWSTTMLNGKKDQTSKPYLILFPIPATQISSNPLLKQNPGY
jgi:hypothetical protein